MRTILLSLCLLLTACGTAAPVSPEGNPAARPQSRQLSAWKDSTLKLLIPGTAGPPIVSSKTIEVPAKEATILFGLQLFAVYDPVANVTSVVMPYGYAGISSPSGLMVFEELGAAIAWFPSYVVLPGNDVDSAIAQFERKYNEESLLEFMLNGPAVRLSVDGFPFFFGDNESELSEPGAMAVESYDVTDNILFLDLNNHSTRQQAVFWIDLKERKQINSAYKGKVE